MGATLGNIHIYKEKPETIKTLLSNEHIILGISKDWVSVLNHSFGSEGSDKTAKKISKSISAPVFAFQYHDDDIMSLSMYKDGKTIARHYMDYSGAAHTKNAKGFVEGFGFEEKSQTRLNKIFKCNNIADKVEMLEEFFGVAFYIDADFIEKGTKEYIRVRKTNKYDEYINNLRKLNKMKNKTNMTMTQEIDARLIEIDPLILAHPDEDGIYELGKSKIYQKTEDIISPITDEFYAEPRLHFIPVRNGYMTRKSFENDDESDRAEEYYLYSKDFTQHRDIILPRGIEIIDTVDNGDVIYHISSLRARKEKANKIIRSTENGEIVWTHVTESENYRIPLTLWNNNIYYSSSSMEDETISLVKININGVVTAKKDIPNMFSNSKLVFANDFIFYASTIKNKKGFTHCLTKIDESLEFVDKIVFDEHVSTYPIPLEDLKHNRIYLDTLKRSYIAVDLKSMEYSIKDFSFDLNLIYIDRQGNIYGVNYGNSVYILDRELNFLSRHHIKGAVCYFYETDTGVHCVTGTSNGGIWEHRKGQCKVFVYRFDYI